MNVDKNINCSGNVNIDNTLTIKEGLVVPDKSTSIVNRQGSIYFNNSSNLFMGYTNNGWNSLGGINPYSDTTITNNLNVDKNINCSGNVNIDDILIVKEGLVVPDKSTSIINRQGSIYFNNSSNLFMGYTNNGWNSLGGINPYSDTIITNNLNVDKNINCSGNVNIDDNLIVKNGIKVPIVPEETDDIIYYVKINGSNKIEIYLDNSFNNLLTDLIINTNTKYIFDYSDASNSGHPFIITIGSSNTSVQLGVADIGNSRYILDLTSVPSGIYIQCGSHSNMGSNYDSKVTVINKNSKILNEMGSIYYNRDSNLFMGYTNNGWNSLGGINPYTDTTITNNLIVNKNINCDGNIITNGILYSNQLIVPNNNQNLLTNVNSNLL